MNQQIKKRLWLIHHFFAVLFGITLVWSLWAQEPIITPDWSVAAPPFNIVFYLSSGKKVVIDDKSLQEMTVEELQNFGYFLAILKVNDYHFSPKTIQIMGEKLLPRFFKEKRKNDISILEYEPSPGQSSLPTHHQIHTTPLQIGKEKKP